MATTRAEDLKRAYIEVFGSWSGLMDDLLAIDPDYFEAYLELSAVPWRCGPLPAKVKELVLLATNASTTHLYEPGVRAHTQGALRRGATVKEIVEVLELTSVLGIHTLGVGVPILLEELAAAGKPVPDLGAELPEREAKLKADFIAVRGYWSPLWDGVLALDPDFFEAYFKFSAVPFIDGALEPKVRELIYIAIDVATTHLFEPGARIHIRNAIELGATREEIMEVFELTSVLGIHTVAVGLPVILAEATTASADA